MGANAQTSVPAFTAGQVLTAAQVTGINTGIPVFASSTERDAAFGGTGEKTLAEGQMAYLEDTDVTQYYDGSSWAEVGASIAGIGSNAVFAQTSTTTSTSSATYVDTSLAATITPTSASSKILIIVSAEFLRNPNNTTRAYLTLFRGNAATGTDLKSGGSGFAQVYSNGNFQNDINVAFVCVDSPATTSATTYTVAIKTSASAVSINGQQSIVVIEVAG
jgi:hypothetical protein